MNMLLPLRRRLTVLCTLLTALVLAGALAVTWRMAVQQRHADNLALFDSAFAALCDRLRDADRVSDRWLAEQETANRALLFLEDNGHPLLFAGSWQPQAGRAALYAQAAAFTGALFAGEQTSFTLVDDVGQPWLGAAARFARGNGTLLVVYLQQNSAAVRAIRALALRYGGLWALGTLLLAGISRWLVGRALAPTQTALQRQNEFIAAASHELRGPLAVLKASLTAVEGPLPPPERAALLRGAVLETDRLARLTEDLLLLAGSDAGALPVALAPLPPDRLETLCIELYEQFGPLARQSGHTLTLTLPDAPLPTVQADAERLRQLLGILLQNAFAHTPHGTAVTLAVRPGPRGGVELRVIDCGPGLTPEQKARVFDRFYRADASRSDRAHFGLGLSVAQQIAAAHQARLWAEDTPGGGATFVAAFG